MKRFFQFFACALLLQFAGCGQPNPFDSVVVKGIVSVDGTPTQGVSVAFIPKDSHGLSAGGLTDQHGNFVLTLPAAPFGSGVLEGEYDATFTKYDMEGQSLNADQYQAQVGNRRPKKTFLIPERYTDPKTSGIESIRVEKKKKNSFDFDLHSK